MKRYSVIFAVLLSLSVMSCRHHESDLGTVLPIVKEALSDTSSVSYHSVSGYCNGNRFGSIAILGSTADAKEMCGRLENFDWFDNGSGQPCSDYLPDFSGERFDVIADNSLEGSYEDFISSNNSQALRTHFVSMALASLYDRMSSNVYENAFDKQKSASKMLILASDIMSDYGAGDIRDLIERKGLDVFVVDMKSSASKYFYSRHSNTSQLYFWKPGENIQESFLEFISSWDYAKPCSGIVVDDERAPEIIAELTTYMNRIAQGSSEEDYRTSRLFAPDFEFIDIREATAIECYILLRQSNMLTMKIEYPQSKLYKTEIYKERLYVLE